MRRSDRQDAASWAHNLMTQNPVILDTETTGLYDGEIVEIAVIDHNGLTLINTYVKPVLPIPEEATDIHGITDQMVKDAPTWKDLVPQLAPLIRGRDLVVYNAVYDRKMMHQSGERHGLEKVDWKTVARWHCAMEMYAQFWGDWNDYHHSYRWQRLTAACAQQEIPEPVTAKAHSAIGDCLRTLALVKCMAKAAGKDEASS